MKYSHKSTHRKTCPHDPDYRAQLGYRLRTARSGMGWSIADAAKYFQVTERTWHNWESGAHRIPYAVYKLCRVLARMELPGEGWAGWSFQGNALITPEGRTIEPRDSSWWSLLCRRAAGFDELYKENARLRHAADQAAQSGEIAAAGFTCPVTRKDSLTNETNSRFGQVSCPAKIRYNLPKTLVTNTVKGGAQ